LRFLSWLPPEAFLHRLLLGFLVLCHDIGLGLGPGLGPGLVVRGISIWVQDKSDNSRFDDMIVLAYIVRILFVFVDN
jgi:hypothetical protein